MANLKDIKNRIRGVSSTHKITSAMKLIATAKLRHSMEAVALIRDYENTLVSAVNASGIDLRKERLDAMPEAPWYLTKEKEKKPHVFLVLGANRGLCGSYNSMVVRQALSLAHKLEDNKSRLLSKPSESGILEEREAPERRRGAYSDVREHASTESTYQKTDYEELRKKSNVLFIPLTSKSSEYFLKNEAERTKPLPGLGFSNKSDYMEIASYVVDQLMHWLEGKEIGAVSIVFGKFVNALVQKVEHFQLFPFIFQQNAEKSPLPSPGKSGTLVEPSFASAAKSVINSLVRIRVCRAFVESNTCEQAARMTMMESAKRNAENLIDKLTLQYNRTRQANITNELIEIVSGTNAMLQE
jgi:F-type H+-transporting ATPase subunit gamma